ncbi:hypothetical protein GW17_00013468 [Ensete ventricosum]|nr:hypothetical protein GW17_00013468 [Ensete ventricosum]
MRAWETRQPLKRKAVAVRGYHAVSCSAQRKAITTNAKVKSKGAFWGWPWVPGTAYLAQLTWNTLTRGSWSRLGDASLYIISSSLRSRFLRRKRDRMPPFRALKPHITKPNYAHVGRLFDRIAPVA